MDVYQATLPRLSKTMTTTGDVWRLRRDVTQHRVHSWPGGPGDRATLLAHKGVAKWGATVLGASIGVAHPTQHRPPGTGTGWLEDLLAHPGDPVAAAAKAHIPAEARALVEVVWSLVTNGSPATRAGAFILGLPCCLADQADALGRLGAPTEAGTRAARAVLEAQVALYDAALTTIRRGQMALHPSAWRSG